MNRSIRFLLLWIAATHGFSTTTSRGAFTRSHRPSLIQLQDVLVQDDRRKWRRRPLRWSRRIWSKIVRKNVVLKESSSRSASSSSSSLHMISIDQETEALMGPSLGQLQGQVYSDASDADFILRNLQELTPDMVGLPTTHSNTLLDSEFYNVAIQEATVAPATAAPSTTKTSFFSSTTFPKNISVARGLAMVVENVLTGLITRHAIEVPEDLAIQARTHGHLVPRLLKGEFTTEAKISVGRLVFPIIRMSSGTLQVKRMTLNIMGFTHKGQSRFPKQFELHADDIVFSRQDLMFSPCIRNGLRRLLVRVLRNRGVETSTVKVTSVDILVSHYRPSRLAASKGSSFLLLSCSHNVPFWFFYLIAFWKNFL